MTDPIRCIFCGAPDVEIIGSPGHRYAACDDETGCGSIGPERETAEEAVLAWIAPRYLTGGIAA